MLVLRCIGYFVLILTRMMDEKGASRRAELIHVWFTRMVDCGGVIHINVTGR